MAAQALAFLLAVREGLEQRDWTFALTERPECLLVLLDTTTGDELHNSMVSRSFNCCVAVSSAPLGNGCLVNKISLNMPRQM